MNQWVSRAEDGLHPFRVVVAETETQWIQRIVGRIRALVSRNRGRESYVEEGFQRVWQQAPESERRSFLLAGFASGIPELRLTALTDDALYTDGYEWQRFLLSSNPDNEWTAAV